MINGALGGGRAIRYGLGSRKAANMFGLENPGGGDDWWLSGGISAANCIAAYQPKGAASYAASKVNLANPGTYDATEGTAPDWDAVNGWKLTEASHHWLDTGILPTANTSAIVRFTNADRRAVLIGSYSGNNTTRFLIDPKFTTTSLLFERAASTIMEGTAKTNGVLAMSSSAEGFYNGSKITDLSGTWSGNATTTIGIGKQNGYTVYCDAYIQAIAIYDIDISSYVSALTTAMNAL